MWLEYTGWFIIVVFYFWLTRYGRFTCSISVVRNRRNRRRQNVRSRLCTGENESVETTFERLTTREETIADSQYARDRNESITSQWQKWTRFSKTRSVFSLSNSDYWNKKFYGNYNSADKNKSCSTTKKVHKEIIIITTTLILQLFFYNSFIFFY